MLSKLEDEWSPNNTLKIEEVSDGSHKKALWICPLGHEYEAIILNRVKNGSGCSVCSGKTVLAGFNDFATHQPDLVKEWHPDNVLKPHEVTKGSSRKVMWICTQGHEYIAKVSNRSRGTKCPECTGKKIVKSAPKSLPKPRKTVIRPTLAPPPPDNNSQSFQEFISQFDTDIVIDYNGLREHSEMFVDKDYHFNRWFDHQQQGKRLITVWEDQWLYTRPVVEKMLTAKIRGSNKKIGARQCTLKQLTHSQSNYFLDTWHIQGGASATFYTGFFYKDLLVGVAVISNKGEVKRYASALPIVGGLDRAMKATGIKSFYTFADHAVSDGSLYEKTGWVKDKVLRPDYKYYAGGRLEHKFGYRLKRFRNDPNLKYTPGATEREMALDNGLLRVYDCGKTRYIKEI